MVTHRCRPECRPADSELVSWIGIIAMGFVSMATVIVLVITLI